MAAEVRVAAEGSVVLVDALQNQLLTFLPLLLLVLDHYLQRRFGFQDIELFVYGRPVQQDYIKWPNMIFLTSLFAGLLLLSLEVFYAFLVQI